MIEQRLTFSTLQAGRIPCPSGSITIMGGVIAEASLVNWLNRWSLQQMPWQIWERVNAIQMDHSQSLPSDVSLLERGRIFGDGGDLSMRRDGNTFRWHFVGPTAVQLPIAPTAHNFWQSPDAPTMLYAVEQQALLWGVWNDESRCWYDDRVGQAKLCYPAKLHRSERVYAHYREYLDHGRVAFVWMYNLGGTPHA